MGRDYPICESWVLCLRPHPPLYLTRPLESCICALVHAKFPVESTGKLPPGPESPLREAPPPQSRLQHRYFSLSRFICFNDLEFGTYDDIADRHTRDLRLWRVSYSDTAANCPSSTQHCLISVVCLDIAFASRDSLYALHFITYQSVRCTTSSGPLKTGLPLRLGQGSHTAATANNQSLLLDKLRARTSTPDSEALASSDDEGDDRQESAHSAAQSAAQPEKPVRRPSWLSETSQTQYHPRKESFASGSMSPTSSHPRILSAETCEGAWGSHSASSVIGRTRGSSTFTWGTGIWNAEREDPPARPSVVLPSSTSTMPPRAASNSFL
ncbi:putative transcriptional regulatory protein, partial [Fusarium oxysporum f. sp. albedinis]